MEQEPADRWMNASIYDMRVGCGNSTCHTMLLSRLMSGDACFADDGFLQHISRETQSSVTLRGRGSIVAEGYDLC